MKKNSEKSLNSYYTGFEICLESLKYDNTLRIKKIQNNVRKKEIEVILKPNEYIKYIESIREQLRTE
jgi:hypothetical protein